MKKHTHTILIVDDEEMIRAVLSQLLTKDGYNILQAEDGVAAIKACAGQNVNLIITDLVMPGKNGIDLIMELKRSQGNIPIIAISGGGGIKGAFDYLSVAKLIGAQEIFPKPIDLEKLKNTVATLLGIPPVK
jgi:DNA-binding NtrC family response regulator